MKTIAIGILLLVCPVIGAAERRSITVTARSEIKVAPDEVVLDLKVHTRDKVLLKAKRENDKITTAVLALTSKHAISATDVKVTDLDVSPDYDRDRTGEYTIVAYDFTRSIQFRLIDFKKIEPLLSDAFDAGLSHVENLQFRVGNQRKHQFDARKMAVKYAREKAEHLSDLTGMKLGLPISISEDVEYNEESGGFGGFGGAIGLKRNSKEEKKIIPSKSKIVFTLFQEADKKKSKDKLIAPGQIVITAHVTIEYEMLPK